MRPDEMSQRARIAAGVLRLAGPADIPALFSIRTAVRENHLDLVQLAERGVTPDSVAAMLGDSKARTWVVEDRGEPLAFIMANARDGSVSALFVRPDAEGRGYGGKLLRAAEEWLFASGWEAIWLNTGKEEQNRAHRFYRGAGWNLAGPADHGDVRYEKRRDA